VVWGHCLNIFYVTSPQLITKIQDEAIRCAGQAQGRRSDDHLRHRERGGLQLSGWRWVAGNNSDSILTNAVMNNDFAEKPRS
jgi:hypothetical protein